MTDNIKEEGDRPDENFERENADKWPHPYEEITIIKTEVKEELCDFKMAPDDMPAIVYKEYVLFPEDVVEPRLEDKLLIECQDFENCKSEKEDLEENVFKCNECCLQFKEEKNFKSHYRVCSPKKNPYNFNCRDADEKPFKCDICEFATVQKVHLRHHTLAKHMDKEKKYRCENCKFSTRQKAHLIQHMYTHSNEKPYKCDSCEFAAAFRSTLKKHILRKHSNTEKKYKCIRCTFSAHGKSDLVVHFRIHTNEKPFKCNRCEFACSLKTNLKRHILVKHSRESKKYKCEYCEYSTHIKSSLEDHIYLHTNERPFKCDKCKFATVQRSRLKSHIFVRHTGEPKMCICDFCGLSTYSKSYLVQHMRIHSK